MFCRPGRASVLKSARDSYSDEAPDPFSSLDTSTWAAALIAVLLSWVR
ncbi:hypothetical protein LCGC14_3075350, partial [marine sediment metagenome]